MSRVGVPRREGKPSLKRIRNDLYPTPQEATLALLHFEKFEGPVWECASGRGDISRVLRKKGYEVISTDLFAGEYDYGVGLDFFDATERLAPNIITNPPYGLLSEFLGHALALRPRKLALHVPPPAILTVGRRTIFEQYGFPHRVYVFVPTLRVQHAAGEKPRPSIFNHTWCVWDAHRSRRPPSLRWVNWREYL
jgi:hypothetical protein